MSKKMKAYDLVYRPDNANTDMKWVVVISVSKSEAIIDLVNAVDVYWIDSIQRSMYEVDNLNQKKIIYHDR